MTTSYKNLPHNKSKIIFINSAPSYCTVGRIYTVGYSKDRRSGYIGQVSLSSYKGITHVSAYQFGSIGWKWRFANDADVATELKERSSQ